jgi:hypothetical protein
MLQLPGLSSVDAATARCAMWQKASARSGVQLLNGTLLRADAYDEHFV